MKMTLKKEVIMTEEERQALSSFLKMITSDCDIDSIDSSWDILTAIADCDYDLAKEYDYYIEIRG